MNPIDYVLIGIIVLIVGGIVTYMAVNKKKNKGCIGCPCAKNCGGCCQSKNDANNK